jgi:hypothetical protein
VRGTRGQRDQGVGRGDEDVELGVVGRAVDVVRVAQVVHGVDERHRASPQRGDHALEGRRVEGVEAEVQVEDVDVVGAGVDPGLVEHRRRPPLLAGGAAYAERRRVGKPHRTASRLGREVADVDVPRGHRGDGDRAGAREGGQGHDHR